MQSLQRARNDLELVIGLKSTDRLLAGPVTRSQIKKHFLNGDQFDRIVLEVQEPSEELLLQAIQLLAPGGLLAVAGVLQESTVKLINRNYPRANVWTLQSSRGPLLLTDARGTPEGV